VGCKGLYMCEKHILRRDRPKICNILTITPKPLIQSVVAIFADCVGGGARLAKLSVCCVDDGLGLSKVC
jgi:hypothetical protein